MVSPVRGDHRRFQAETPLIDLFKFAEPALSIIENLKRIAKKAENLGDARGLQAARASWEGVARISGLIVERREVGDPGEFARMTDAELNESLAAQARALGLPDSAIERLLILGRPSETAQ